MSTITANSTPPAVATTARQQNRRRQDLAKRALAVLVLTLLGVLFFVPFLWMFVTSIKDQRDIFNPTWIPHPIVWGNYKEALTSVPFGIYFRNTAIITVLSVVGTLLSSSLVVPTWLGSGAFYIFLLRQFFRGIPRELSEAAKIDGAGELRIWWQIYMPLARPALAAITIFSFNGAWDDYINPLIYLHSEKLYTLQLGLTAFKGGGGGVPEWHLMMAASLVVLLPIVIVFFIGQKYFIEGVSLSGLGGR
jgi:ABC-type glycerol-3-phosphate transport system permease component